jgi:hypothetical protein
LRDLVIVRKPHSRLAPVAENATEETALAK